MNHDVFTPPARENVPGKPDRERAERQILAYIAGELRQDFHNGMSEAALHGREERAR